MEPAPGVQDQRGLRGQCRKEGEGFGVGRRQRTGRMRPRGEIQVKVQPWQDVGAIVAAARANIGLAAGVLDRHAEIDGVLGAERLGSRRNARQRGRRQIVPERIEGLASVCVAPRRAGPREQEIALAHARIERLKEMLGLRGNGL